MKRPSLNVLHPRLLCAGLVAALCLAAGSTLASGISEEMRASFSDRVLFDAGEPGEQFDSYIVYYRGDEVLDEEGIAAGEWQDTRALVDAGIARVNDRLGHRVKYERRLGTGGHLIRIGSDKLATVESDRFMIEFASDPNVVSIEPNARAYAQFVPNDARYTEQWGLRESVGGINAEAAWDRSRGGGIVIAILDTGSTPHPDLDAQTIAGYDFISDPANGRDGNGRDGNPNDEGDHRTAGECGPDSDPRNSSWHGTHVAGIAAARTNNAVGIAGTAPNSRLQHVRVLGKCGGSLADISDGIIWASGGNVPGVPVNPTRARVLNLSLGGAGACGTTYQNAVNSARSRGSVVVVAAGNENMPVAGARPANCSGVIAVAASNRAGRRANYSNYGPEVDVAAPGGETSGNASNGILSTLNSGTRQQQSPTYGFYQGTSMATPYVAGVAALMLTARSSLTPDQVETILRNTARPFPAVCTGGCGTGIIDANAAVRAAQGGNLTQYPLTVYLYGNGSGSVSSTPGGINCGNTCSARFSAGTSVTLRATPAAGLQFAGWSGACSGTSATCSVNMNQARQVFATFQVPIVQLSNGTPRNGLSTTSSSPLMFSLNVPAGATNLRFEISGGSGDADLYVRRGQLPTQSTYDCRPFLFGNVESCQLSMPLADTYFVMLAADPSFSGVSLRASYTAPVASGGALLNNGTAITGLSAPKDGARYYRLVVPAGATNLRIETQGGTGDMDMFVRHGAVPTFADNHCAPQSANNNEVCTAANPSAGTYYILLYGFSQYSGVRLTGSYSAPSTPGGNNNLTVSWNGMGAGTVQVRRAMNAQLHANCTALPCTTALFDSQFDLIATPAAGSRFVGWITSQCASITAQGNCRVRMNQARNVQARFTRASTSSPTLTVERAGNGNGTVRVSRVNPRAVYGTCTSFPCRLGPVNATFEMVAIPAAGSQFSGWPANQCDSITAQGHCWVRISRPITLTARFTR